MYKEVKHNFQKDTKYQIVKINVFKYVCIG